MTKFESKELMSPYTIPPHDLYTESNCYILMYIADRPAVNDCIKASSLKNSVSHITKSFSRIAGRLPKPFITEQNIVKVVIDAKGHVVKNPTPDSVMNPYNQTTFVEIVNRIDTRANYEYQNSIPSNYFLKAIGQHCHKKSLQKGGLSYEEKIWCRSDKTKEFQHVRSFVNDVLLEWSTTAETKILKEGVVFVYSWDDTW